ncbi:hypothetical protein BRADI_2g46176v3 [Brachypodium distachyon]|uniref:Uncharacterized protein n=1 Tax=Brachypodium distachyon TaxID=15368 RepID=A0A0Q3J9U4_BRADI|nr:hypothetical protein BRADI_2g46176v3 [Brachypodium distachyon]
MEGRKVPRPRDDDKTSWPELVGGDYMAAAFAIMQNRPDVRVFFHGSAPPPAGFDPKRVALFYDAHHIVTSVPNIG